MGRSDRYLTGRRQQAATLVVDCGNGPQAEDRAMWKEFFEQYLRRSGRSPSATQRAIALTEEFEAFLAERDPAKALADAGVQDLDDFVAWVEEAPKRSAKLHLWALVYYFGFRSDDVLLERARALRSDRIQRKPFKLSEFRGIDKRQTAQLASVGIVDVAQMRDRGATPPERLALSQETGVPLESIEEFVRLSDLARIPGLKGIRARLYYDAGIDSGEALTKWEPEDLRQMLIDFVAQTGFDGIPPLAKEVRSAVAKARKLPKIIEYGDLTG